MQKFIAENSFWELFPHAAIGVIVVRGMKPTAQISAEDTAAIAEILMRANDEAKQYLTSDVISENEVVRVWRDAFQKFKSKKGARCTIENLLKRVLKGNPVGSITPSVDVCNAMALKYALPIGGENIDAMSGDFRLGVTEGDDVFLPLGEEKDDPTLPGELCYRDDVGAICRCWNWRDGQRTALSDTSSNAVLVVECIELNRIEHLNSMLDEFVHLMEKYFGATIEIRTVVDRANPEVVLVP